MKTRYIAFAALALMGTLAGCQKESFPSRPDNAVSVNFSVGSMLATRSNAAATDASQTKFNSGDQIAVSTNDQEEAVLFQCTSTENQTWAEAVPNKFLLWTADMLTFSAYYPVTTGTSMTAFTVPTDQSTEAYINAADYMTVTKTISRPEGGTDISLELERQMARVIVTISGFNDQYASDKKTVSNVRIYSKASGIADGAATGSVTAVTPYANGTGTQGTTYTALVVPGNSDDSADFITLTDGEGSTLLVKGIPEMQAGYSYTFNLVVGKNKIEVQSVTVTDWTTGETLAGGQAEEQTGAAAGITDPQVGQIIGSDGKNYAADATLPTGVTKVAMIAYINGSNGLAIQLNSSPVSKDWAEAKTYAEGLNTSTPIAGGTWRLPSKADWQNMFVGCAVSGDASASDYMDPIAGFKAKIAATGTTWQSDYYWSSTPSEYDGKAWGVDVYLYGSRADAYFRGDVTSYSSYVLGCLAF